MSRSRMSRGRSRKVFRKTSSRVHRANLPRKVVSRGGFRV